MISAISPVSALLLFLVQTAVVRPHPLETRATIVDSASSLNERYDYVVIGGGTSGLTVANRLTEDPSVSVLVIEYGPLDKLEPGVLVPGVPPPTEYSRNYQSVPQPGLNDRSQPVSSAAVVGGGTVINGLFFNRGSAADYDSWLKLGNPGWGWIDLLPYFKKSETFNPAPRDLTAQYPISNDLGPHGTDGPVQSSFPQYQYPVLRYFYKAWNSIGVPSNPQPNDGRPVDAFYSTLSITAFNQSRCSASTAYFRPIEGKRANFHLLTLHSVTKILINKEKRATGVEYVSRNNTKDVLSTPASREVIVAAGALRSPQLLQISGIGPRKLLKGLGIKVMQDLPGVGYNFQDQPTMYASVTYDYSKYPYPTPQFYFTNQSWVAEQLAIYYQNRTGPDTQAYLSGTTVAFLSLQRLTNQYQEIIQTAKQADLKKALPAGADKTLLEGYKAQQSAILADYGSPDTAVHELAAAGGETIPLVLIKPLSRGSILINSSDPLANPVFDYGTFQHPADVQVFVAIYKKFRQFVGAEPWKAVGLRETSPGPGLQGDGAIEAAIRNISVSTWQHPVGTCAMMPKKHGGVVDPQLRVYGIKALSVVDASMMPIIPATHTSAPVYAVAEKAADLIKQRRRRS